MPTTAATIEINTTVDLQNNTAHCSVKPPRFDPYRIEVRPGDTVIWNFQSVPYYKPAVVFTAFTPRGDTPDAVAHPLGAFESLQQEGDRISGIAGPGAVGTHEYWFWLVPMKPGLSYRRLVCQGQSEATIIDRPPPGQT